MPKPKPAPRQPVTERGDPYLDEDGFDDNDYGRPADHGTALIAAILLAIVAFVAVAVVLIAEKDRRAAVPVRVTEEAPDA